jgi:hypothetical protein
MSIYGNAHSSRIALSWLLHCAPSGGAADNVLQVCGFTPVEQGARRSSCDLKAQKRAA